MTIQESVANKISTAGETVKNTVIDLLAKPKSTNELILSRKEFPE